MTLLLLYTQASVSGSRRGQSGRRWEVVFRANVDLPTQKKFLFIFQLGTPGPTPDLSEAVDESRIVHGFLFAIQPDAVRGEGGRGGDRGLGVHLDEGKKIKLN